ncbi:MAG: hypothetical protein JWN48_1236 [Myxococcaceae bacterium]|nr:hypothetical protein [Myxococcaceae bacterium]
MRLLGLGLALSAALALGACEGPTLEVGERLAFIGDAGDPLDGAVSRLDGSTRTRDANLGDRDPRLEERRCFADRDCLFTSRSFCQPARGVCVECYEDWQCPSGDCVKSEASCRPLDHAHDDNPPSPP